MSESRQATALEDSVRSHGAGRDWGPLMTMETPRPNPSSPAPPAGRPKRSRVALRKVGAAFAGIASVGAILGGLAGYWSTYRTVTTELLAPPAPNPTTSRPSIVVLPFTNRGATAQP